MKYVSDAVERTYQATLARALPKGERLWPVRGGKVLIDITSFHTMPMRVARLYEPGRYRHLARGLQPGGVFLDVGGHRGDFTVWAARRASVVHCFEPLPANVDRIARAVAANGLTNVVLHGAAVSDKAGTATLNVAPGTGWNTLVEPTTFTATGTLEVQTVALDDLVDHADVIKMDVEGAELAALDGARRLLTSANLVVLDVHAFAGVDPLEVRNRLEAAGLEVSGTRRMVARRPT